MAQENMIYAEFKKSDFGVHANANNESLKECLFNIFKSRLEESKEDKDIVIKTANNNNIFENEQQWYSDTINKIKKDNIVWGDCENSENSYIKYLI